MSDAGKQLLDALYSLHPQEALQLVTSWDQQRIQDAAQYEDMVRMLLGMILCDISYTLNMSRDGVALWYNMGHIHVLHVCIIPQIDNTPLHMACVKDLVKVVEVLLKHGADTKAKDIVSTGLNPLYPFTPLPMMMVHLYDDDAVPARHADASSHRMATHHCTVPARRVLWRWWRCC